MRDKIKYIIDNYGQATSEGNIYWDDRVNILDLKDWKNKKIVTDKHPLNCIVDELLELFGNKKNV